MWKKVTSETNKLLWTRQYLRILSAHEVPTTLSVLAASQVLQISVSQALPLLYGFSAHGGHQPESYLCYSIACQSLKPVPQSLMYVSLGAEYLIALQINHQQYHNTRSFPSTACMSGCWCATRLSTSNLPRMQEYLNLCHASWNSRFFPNQFASLHPKSLWYLDLDLYSLLHYKVLKAFGFGRRTDKLFGLSI